MLADFSSHGLSLLHWRWFGCGIIRCCRCSTRHAAAPWLGVQLSGHWHLPPYPTLAAPAVPVWVDCSLSTECRHLECPATPAPLRGTATHVDGDGGAAPRHGGHNSNHNTSSENAKARGNDHTINGLPCSDNRCPCIDRRLPCSDKR